MPLPTTANYCSHRNVFSLVASGRMTLPPAVQEQPVITPCKQSVEYGGKGNPRASPVISPIQIVCWIWGTEQASELPLPLMVHCQVLLLQKYCAIFLHFYCFLPSHTCFCFPCLPPPFSFASAPLFLSPPFLLPVTAPSLFLVPIPFIFPVPNSLSPCSYATFPGGFQVTEMIEYR